MEVKVVRHVLDANNAAAARNRMVFAEKKVMVINVMSSPGSGKTATLIKTIEVVKDQLRCAVIVGDICTTRDAERLAVCNVPVVQVNTNEFGGDCHLAAHVISKALENIDLDAVDLLIVENVGNLVCPAEFDIGEDLRVVVLSVTEGEDKPLKYPLMFRACQAALLNKIDLLPYLDYDLAAVKQYIHQINPDMPVFEVSARDGRGISDWSAWMKRQTLAKTH